MKKRIYSDVYNIAKRVKEIDKYYYIVLNTSTNKFEVHNSVQIGSTYCLTVPYTELDERTLTYIHKTKSSNIDEILSKIENENKIKESAEKQSTLSNFYDAVQDFKEITWKL